MVNKGTYSFPNVSMPGGPIKVDPFFSIVNSRVTDTLRYDNFNFNTGFSSSFKVTEDSLVFYGVNVVDTTGINYPAARVYVR